MSFFYKNKPILALAAVMVAVSYLLFFFPLIDIAISRWFFDGLIFPWTQAALPQLLHNMVHPLAICLGVVFTFMVGWTFWKKSGWRRWAFLWLSLVIAPGLVANTLLKDNWGRARPYQVEAFGGTAQFTPPFVMTNQCVKNCSFVGGDSSFGFWFHSFAYIAPRRRRVLFWSGLGLGGVLGVVRIGMGAHFFSDVVIGGMIMIAVSALIFRLLFGMKAMRILWADFCGIKPKS